MPGQNMQGLKIYYPTHGQPITNGKVIIASGWADPLMDVVSGTCSVSGSGPPIQGKTVAYTHDPGTPVRPAGHRWLILFQHVPDGLHQLTVTGKDAQGDVVEQVLTFNVKSPPIPDSIINPPLQTGLIILPIEIINPPPNPIDPNNFNPYGLLPASGKPLGPDNPSEPCNGPVVLKLQSNGTCIKADTSDSDVPSGVWWAQFITAIPTGTGSTYVLNVKYADGSSNASDPLSTGP